jgi:hypothetical protein
MENLIKPRIALIKNSKRVTTPKEVNELLFITLLSSLLEKERAAVNIYEENEFNESRISESLVIASAKGKHCIEKLEKAEMEGITVINSSESILNCNRANMSGILSLAGIPFPKTITIASNTKIDKEVEQFDSDIVWLKKDEKENHSEPDTFCSLRNQTHCNATLGKFKNHISDKLIMQENIAGDIISFYGIRETGYFYWTYADAVTFTRFERDSLFSLVDSAAWLLGLSIYGGQVVVKEDGSIVIIDMDAFPDFAPIREQAAAQVASFILSKAVMLNYIS